MRPLKLVVPACLAVAATGAVAVAAIPNADGTISGCYITSSSAKGLLRVVDEGVACKASETPISWSQRGARGERGPAGPAGGESLTLGGEPVSEGRADVYLTLPGVTGSSRDAGHVGDIPLRSFQFELRSSATASVSNGARTSFGAVRVTKFVDGSSTALMRLLARTTRVPRMTISFRTSGASRDFLRHELRDVVVTQYAQGGRAEPAALESVSLEFAEIASTQTTIDGSGTAGATTAFGWDQLRQLEP